MSRRHWLVKQEPEAFSWDDFVRDGGTAWTGVRSHAARLNLLGMRLGDDVLFYHSVTGKCVVGIARVAREAYADPTAEDEHWVCVDIVPVKPLKHPVSLAAIKGQPALKDILLVRQSRLSVIPLGAQEYAAIIAISKRRPA